jgi:general secretion pathway protein F
MTRYRYRAARADGRVVAGTIAASSGVEVDALLIDQGLYPIALVPAGSGTGARRAAGRRDLAIVFRSLATLVAAGVPLERAVAASERLPRLAALRSALGDTRRLLVEGHSLAEALARSEGPVPAVVIGMLRAGERGSRLGPALEQAATQLEHEADLAGRIRQALAYPLILLVAGACSLGVITTIVIPRFAVILADLGQALPPATRLLLGTAHVIRSYGLFLLIGLAGAVGLILQWTRTPEGRLQLHRFSLRLPVLGPVRHGFATARAGRALGSLLATGVPILNALQAAREAAGDAEVADRLGRVVRRVGEGEALTASLMIERAVTPTALQVLAVGDSSGQLGPMALRAGDLAAAEAEGGLRVLVSLLEPALVVLFGGMVAFTAAALLQAVYSLRPG